MLEKLNKMFFDRYDKVFLELNKNVSIAARDGSVYDVPSVILGKGGGTISTADAFELSEPAQVEVSFKKKKMATAIYRILIPSTECEVAAKNPAYFNYLFDRIMSQAIANYNATFGGPDALRFGDAYCRSKGLSNSPREGIELRLSGNWASDEDPSVQVEQQEGA